MDIGPTKTKSELEVYKGLPVRIRTPVGNSLGFLEKISAEYASLKPSLVNEGLYDAEDKLLDNYIMQNELPQMVKLATIIDIEPLTSGYMEKLAQNLNENSKFRSKKDSKKEEQ